ncbi:MAG TPA: type II secretion system inner membrane protein GspF [Candidatus Saccharimonadia bacterium]|nr:type II secretion system inner membrane protein GspF [Candidatus Saccharimonadia bacterium]
MALFRYKAVATTGETIEGQMEAASREEVIGKLQDAGNIPLEASEASEGGGAGFGTMFRRAEMTPADVTQFTQQLSTLLGAGQPLDRALQILIELPDEERARKLIERVREVVRGGAPLSQALEQQHGVFSRLYVNMVRAGEASGALQDTLKRLTEYLDRASALRSSVVNALIYPMIIIAAVVIALGILMIYVVPQFVPIFQDMGADLPLITRVVLAISNFLQGFWWVLLAGAVATGFWFRAQFQEPDKRKRIEERLLRLKLVGGLLLKLDTARLARTLGTLLHNGVPLLTALSISRNVLGNSVLADSVEIAEKDVKTGNGLGYALGQTKRWPRLALQMIAVGEESGELEAMLERVADTFDVEVRNNVDRLLAALTPVVTIFLAIVIAFIMMAILLPILSLSSTIG